MEFIRERLIEEKHRFKTSVMILAFQNTSYAIVNHSTVTLLRSVCLERESRCVTAFAHEIEMVLTKLVCASPVTAPVPSNFKG